MVEVGFLVDDDDVRILAESGDVHEVVRRDDERPAALAVLVPLSDGVAPLTAAGEIDVLIVLRGEVLVSSAERDTLAFALSVDPLACWLPLDGEVMAVIVVALADFAGVVITRSDGGASTTVSSPLRNACLSVSRRRLRASSVDGQSRPRFFAARLRPAGAVLPADRVGVCPRGSRRHRHPS